MKWKTYSNQKIDCLAPLWYWAPEAQVETPDHIPSVRAHYDCHESTFEEDTDETESSNLVPRAFDKLRYVLYIPRVLTAFSHCNCEFQYPKIWDMQIRW